MTRNETGDGNCELMSDVTVPIVNADFSTEINPVTPKLVSSKVTLEKEPSPNSTLVIPADIRAISVIPASSQSTYSSVATLISSSPYKAVLGA